MLKGTWQLPESSDMVDADLALGSDDYVLYTPAHGNLTGNAADLVFSDRLGNIPRKVTLADGSLFETSDNDEIDLWLKQHRNHFNILHRLEQHWQAAALALVMTVFFSIGLYLYGLPAAAKGLAFAVPDSVLQKVGDKTMEFLQASMVSETRIPAEKQQQVLANFQTLLAQRGYDSDAFDISFRRFSRTCPFRDQEACLPELPSESDESETHNSEKKISQELSQDSGEPEEWGDDTANAFALPSGQIIFTDGLIKKAANQHELDAILLHEIAHVERRHAMQQVARSTIITLVIAYMSGDASGLEEFIVGTTVFLTTAQYSRKFEAEADSIAFKQMAGLNIDPIHFAYALSRITSDNDAETKEKVQQADSESDNINQLLEYLSTHPETEKRLLAAKRASEKFNKKDES